jgi:hypothetical protein
MAKPDNRKRAIKKLRKEFGPLDQTSEDALKLDALRRAAQLGLADIILGQFQDVKSGSVDAAVERLGVEAGKRSIKTT